MTQQYRIYKKYSSNVCIEFVIFFECFLEIYKKNVCRNFTIVSSILLHRSIEIAQFMRNALDFEFIYVYGLLSRIFTIVPPVLFMCLGITFFRIFVLKILC